MTTGQDAKNLPISDEEVVRRRSGAGGRKVARLAPGQSITLPLQFTNPDNIVFSYETRVLAGPGSR